MNRRKAKAKVLRGRYEMFLTELMINVQENGKFFHKKSFAAYLTMKDISNRFHRSVLLEQILMMRKHVGGFEAENLKELYLKLHFDKEAIKKLRHRRWYLRLNAVQELSLMEIDGLAETFQLMAVDEHQMVRIAALRALILRGGNWQQALAFYNYNLSLWEQYQMCDSLSHRQSIQLPDFSPLLQSLNRSVVLFGLKMIKQFHCLENVTHAEPFLLSKDIELKEAAQAIMKQFGLDFEIEEEDLVFDDLGFSNLDFNNIEILEDYYHVKGGTKNNDLLNFEILD
jgi:hypothetical protein